MIDLIIDTDPGVDDLIALLLALASPDALKLRAITVVAGNVGLKKTVRNACMALEWAGRPDVPVFAGAFKPLRRKAVDAAHVHGEEGLPAAMVHCPVVCEQPEDAVSYLVRTLRDAAPASITLAMLGPQTNLALALAQAPEIVRGLREVVIMGGAHHEPGNVTALAEFNLFADPDAALQVLRSGAPLTYVPLDVTHKVLTTPARLEQLAAAGAQTGPRVCSLLQHYALADSETCGLTGGPIHDACVIGWLLQPALFKGVHATVRVEVAEGPGWGQTRVLESGADVVPADADGQGFWLHDADAQGFFDLLSQRLARLG